MTGATAAITGVSASRCGDVAAAACQTWLDQQRQCQALTMRWQQIEASLVREHNWFQLSRRQRSALPEARELEEIDDRLDALHKSKQKILVALPQLAAITTDGLASKLEVAAACVRPEENAEAHRLLKSILHDIKLMAARM